MPTPTELTVETIHRMAAEIVGMPLSEADAASIVGLLKLLDADMKAFRAMDAGENEPALVYNPAEVES